MPYLNTLYREADMSESPLLEARQQLLKTLHSLEQLAPEIPHPARYWEYGQALRACQAFAEHEPPQPWAILEIGGSDSILMPTIMRIGAERAGEIPITYTSVELPDWVANYSQRRMLQCPQPLRQLSSLPSEEFDLVLAISVIEHIADPFQAFEDWAKRVRRGGVLFLTSDVGEHDRDDYMFHWMRAMKDTLDQRFIWTPDTWAALGFHPQFEFIGPQDWTWPGATDLGYTFGSMALRRIR